MPDEPKPNEGTPPGGPSQTPPVTAPKAVELGGMVLIAAYLLAFSIFLLYGLGQFWPPPPPAAGQASGVVAVAFFNTTFSLSDEVRLMIVVALAGALGGLVHALRSFYWYVGNRRLYTSWISMYIMLPFVGSTLALIFYFVVRGGFFSPQASIQQTSPFGFVALAGLVGLFTEQAVEKLKEVAEKLLAPPPKAKGSDTVLPEGESTPGGS